MIKALMVVELMGSPKDHISELIKSVVENLEKEKDVKINKKHISETEEVKGGFWGNFAELEIEVNEVSKLIDLSFDYMPSSIEILEPEKVELKMDYTTNLINDLLARLHKYDMLIKNFYAENKLMKDRLKGKK